MLRHTRRLPLDAEYHDGVVEAVEVGPRREVVLVVRLDPVWNGGDESTRRLHFSAIDNFDEVATFFRQGSPGPGGAGYVDEVVGIVLISQGIIGVDLARLGYVEIRGAKVREY
jgi:hypothetical protein